MSCVGLANALMWARVKHRPSTMLVIVALAVIFASITVFAVTRAMRINIKLVPEHRLMLKREIRAIDMELVHGDGSADTDDDAADDIVGAYGDGDDGGVAGETKKRAPMSKLLRKLAKDRRTRLLHSRDLLRAVDDLIAYEEETYEPARVMGIRADPTTIRVLVGTLFGGLFVAFEAYRTGEGYGYDPITGWYGPI